MLGDNTMEYLISLYSQFCFHFLLCVDRKRLHLAFHFYSSGGNVWSPDCRRTRNCSWQGHLLHHSLLTDCSVSAISCQIWINPAILYYIYAYIYLIPLPFFIKIIMQVNFSSKLFLYLQMNWITFSLKYIQSNDYCTNALRLTISFLMSIIWKAEWVVRQRSLFLTIYFNQDL